MRFLRPNALLITPRSPILQPKRPSALERRRRPLASSLRERKQKLRVLFGTRLGDGTCFAAMEELSGSLQLITAGEVDGRLHVFGWETFTGCTLIDVVFKFIKHFVRA